MEFFGLANYQYLDNRLVIDDVTLQNILSQYQQFNISNSFSERVRNIEFGVEIPPPPAKPSTPPLKILYAGRGTPQKRIWLLNRIVEHFINKEAAVEFIFAGSMSDELSDTVKEKCIVYGEIGDKNTLNRLYNDSHAIILTSAFEGFPVVIKEGMSFGCIPIVTALPGNKTHLQNLQNALLIESPEDELMVVQHAIQNIELLLSHPVLMNEISANAYKYAKENFTRDEFLKKYKELLA